MLMRLQSLCLCKNAEVCIDSRPGFEPGWRARPQNDHPRRLSQFLGACVEKENRIKTWNCGTSGGSTVRFLVSPNSRGITTTTRCLLTLIVPARPLIIFVRMKRDDVKFMSTPASSNILQLRAPRHRYHVAPTLPSVTRTGQHHG